MDMRFTVPSSEVPSAGFIARLNGDETNEPQRFEV